MGTNLSLAFKTESTEWVFQEVEINAEDFMKLN